MGCEDVGWLVFAGATGLTLLGCYVVTHVRPVDWCRRRLLSQDRWTRAAGALPIAFPVYVLAGMVFSAGKC